MAAGGQCHKSEQCIKCKQKYENTNEKIIKCNGICNGFLHYTCSTFKPTELKFFEANNNNVKWYCDPCANTGQNYSMHYLQENFVEINKKLELMMALMAEQNKKIENQTKIIHNLRTGQVPQAQNASTQEILQRPNTRANSVTAEALEHETKSQTKVAQTIQLRKQKQLTSNKDKPHESASQNNSVHKNIEKSKETLEEKTSLEQKPANKINTVRGKRLNTTLTAAENLKWIFISQLVDTTTEIDVRNYLHENTIKVSSCAKLQIRNENIAAFKISANEENYAKMLEPELWPINTIIRPFRTRNFQKSQVEKTRT